MTDIDPPIYFFWLGKEAEDDAFDAAFALWAYNLDGSGAARKWREIFPTGDPLDNLRGKS
jgi:hypothetical protein